MDVPHGPAGLTPHWLTDALRETGTIHNASVRSFQARAIGEDKGIVGQLARLCLAYDADEEDAPRTLIAKFPRADPAGRAIQLVLGVVPEVMFYTQLADHAVLRTPHCYYGAFDPTGAFVLLLEDLAPARNGDTVAGCCAAEAELALRHLARFHARWWESPQLAETRWLVGVDPAAFRQVSRGYRHVLSRTWPRFCQSVGETLPRETVEVGERLLAHFDTVVEGVYLDPPRTLVHNDYHLDNLFFSEPLEGAAQCDAPLAVIDWQNVWAGHGAADVAFFLCRSLPVEERRRLERGLLATYHRTLVEHGVQGYPFDQCLHDYRLAMFPALLRLVGLITSDRLVPAQMRRFCEVLLPRCCTAIRDLDAGALLPA